MIDGEKITTPRLFLIPTSSELLQVEMFNIAELSQILETLITENWPPEFMKNANPLFLLQLQCDPKYYKWCTWYWVLKGAETIPNIMIGCGGFMGLPDKKGLVELGYSILLQFEGRGFATEGADALLQWAFTNEAVKSVAAETYPHLNKSLRVLDKLGFSYTGKGFKPNTIRFLLSRADYKFPLMKLEADKEMRY